MKPLLDEGFLRKEGGPQWWLPAAFVALFLVRGVFTFVTSYALSWVANRVLADMREQMFARLVSLPASFFVEQSPGKLVSRLVFEANNVTAAATDALTGAVKESLVVVGLFGWLLWLNWKLTLIAAFLVPVTAIAISLFSKRMRRLSRENLKITGELAHVVEEAIQGQDIIKVYGGQRREAERFRSASDKLRAFARRVVVAEATVVPVTQTAAALADAADVWFAMFQSQSDQVTVGGFVSFVTAMLMLLAPLKRIASVSGSLQRGLAAAEAVFELIDQKPEQDRGTVEIGRARGAIAFEAVRLRYPGARREALAGIELEIRPGEVVALVGPSGGGKTSLANLVPRFWEPTSGRVLIDGRPADELTLASLRRQIALVGQSTTLFDDTVAANIAYGAGREVTREEILAVASAAHLDDALAGWPDGLDTRVGADGVKLSGGQRQRVAIARALLKDAPILILDEATSALDNESERAVQAAFERLMRGRTTLVIAHRLDTIRNANRILVMVEGRIAEEGAPHDLMHAGGLYAEMARCQLLLPVHTQAA